MSDKKKFVVVMSTYNGEKYLKLQIESILKQEDIEVQLIVRDDGSKDKTIEILEKYRDNKELIWYSGDNLKPAKSFLNLLEYVENNINDLDYDYVAFADQDDIWDSQKLKTAAEQLSDKYDLYFCSMEPFYDSNPSMKSLIKAVILPKGEVLFRSSTAGCAMAFNKKVLHTINQYHPNYIEMHDSWILRVCTVLDYCIYADSRALIQYRIHGNNACGSSISFREKIINHTRYIFYNKDISSETAHELLNGYANRINSYYKDMLVLIDRKQEVERRKSKLLRRVIIMRFSTFSRKVTCIFKILMGSI